MNKLSFLLLIILLFTGLVLPARQVHFVQQAFTAADTVSKVQDTSITRADSVIMFAKKFLGTPYKYASASPQAGFDCSGFTYYVFMKAAGIVLPRSSRDLDKTGYDVPLKECRKGDLILFKGTDPNSTRVGHVGIIISEQGQPVEFIHSSSSKKHWGVVISNMEKDYYTKRFVKIKRVL